MWDVETKAVIRALRGHRGRVSSVLFSEDERFIISASYDKTIHIWNSETGETIATLEGHRGPVTSVSLSPDNTHIVTGSWDETVRIWDINKYK
jgi:WD40 repeat protein